MTEKLGEKIKTARLAKKMTLKELAEKTQLSISFLSMVERGLTSAAVVSLKKIAEALDMDLSAFFEKTEDEQKNGFVRSYENRIRYTSGYCIYKNLSACTEKCEMDPMMIILLPGQSREDVSQTTHAGEEFIYVLEGVLTYYLNGQENVLYPGDSYHSFGNVPHTFVNLSNNLTKVLYIVTPPLSVGNFNL